MFWQRITNTEGIQHVSYWLNCLHLYSYSYQQGGIIENWWWKKVFKLYCNNSITWLLWKGKYGGGTTARVSLGHNPGLKEILDKSRKLWKSAPQIERTFVNIFVSKIQQKICLTLTSQLCVLRIHISIVLKLLFIPPRWIHSRKCKFGNAYW